MKKKLVIVGPILSRSGYGEMARFAYRALKNQDKYDVYAVSTNWGGTGTLPLSNAETTEIVKVLEETEFFIKESNNISQLFDVSLQVTIPSEWKGMAKTNIGYTAGIETNMISPKWLQPSNQMNKIIVISEHAKSSFVNTRFGDANGNVFKVDAPVFVCHFPKRIAGDLQLDLNLKHDFNFLSICQWGPRKNLEQTIVNFIEEFKNEEVGLVLKINTVNDSILDRDICEQRLTSILNNFPNRKCSVHLLHGLMKDEELLSLYRHPKIKAIVSTTHGEGFGFPLFEAACNELPVIATDWSGHLDFLTMKDESGADKKMFAKIDFSLEKIKKEQVWEGVLEESSMWAFPLTHSVRGRMRELYKDHSRFKSWAKKLSKNINDQYTEEKIYNKFLSLLEETGKNEYIVF